MTNEPSEAQISRAAANLDELLSRLVRVSIVLGAGIESGPERQSKLDEMIPFVMTAARITGEDNGIVLVEGDLSVIAASVVAEARTALALMPAEGGRA